MDEIFNICINYLTPQLQVQQIIGYQVRQTLKPQIADQVALGYYQNLKKNTFKISTEIYYKHLANQNRL